MEVMKFKAVHVTDDTTTWGARFGGDKSLSSRAYMQHLVELANAKAKDKGRDPFPLDAMKGRVGVYWGGWRWDVRISGHTGWVVVPDLGAESNEWGEVAP